MAALPLFAYIPMGTGNGVGSVVGCSPPRRLFGSKKRHLQTTFERLKQLSDDLDHADYEVVKLPMLQVSSLGSSSSSSSSPQTPPRHRSDLCFFAGIGFDSLLLSDFKTIKAWSARTGFLKRSLSSVAGYCVALIVKTLPQCAWSGRHKVHVELTSNNNNDDDETLWIDHRRGDVAIPCPDKLLYRGTTGILAAGTSPYYGGGLRLFPFSRVGTDTMHVRLGRIHPFQGIMNLKSIFAGSYRDKSPSDFGVLDFIGKDFSVQIKASDGFPLQHSGESVGSIQRFRLRVMDEPVRFISLWEPRVVVEEE